MCGRYEINIAKEELENIINTVENRINKDYKTGEIYPTNIAPVIMADAGTPVLTAMAWGFPRWDGKGVIINGKSETIQEKKTFAKSIQKTRCVIPSTGFYEWKEKPGEKKKDKYRFTRPGAPLLYMAGIYSSYKTDNGPEDRFVILTRDANDYMRGIHDRMPVILRPDEIGAWTMDDQFVDFALQRSDTVLAHELAD